MYIDRILDAEEKEKQRLDRLRSLPENKIKNNDVHLRQERKHGNIKKIKPLMYKVLEDKRN